jgi:DNA-directed RNA polymerase specialized sigma24 family protein
MKDMGMTRSDRTTMGGPDRRFETTHWTEILSARTLDQGRQRDAIGAVLARYWKPMYCYLRRKGNNNEEAKDLVQGFCQEIALDHGLLQQADPERGRFRTFLLTSLSNYASNVRQAGATRKRAPAGAMFALDDIAATDIPVLSDEATPDEAFNCAWAAQLIDDVLAAVQAGCCHGGKGVHWAVFLARTVTPLLTNTKPPSLSTLCAKHHIPDEAKASNMIITVKRRFQAELVRQVRLAVGSDADVQKEIGDLLKILSNHRAG